MHALPTQDDLSRIWQFIQAGNAVPKWSALAQGSVQILTYAKPQRSWSRDVSKADGVWRVEERLATHA